MTDCANCGAKLTGEYCSQCGQRDLNLERPINTLVGELARETFDIDGRVARTIWTLLRHPGELTHQFLAGRRQLYTSPLRLYVAISVVFFLVAAWVAGRGGLLDPTAMAAADASRQARFFSDELPLLMFVLLPAFAFALKLLFRRHLYFHHLIHAVHLHAAAYLVLALLLPLERAAEEHVALLTIQLALLVYLLVYLNVSMRRVYREGWLATIGKMLAAVVIHSIMIGSSFELLTFLALN